MKLGEKISEGSGQTTTLRVLPGDGYLPNYEVTFQETIRLLGVEGVNIGTFETVTRPDGVLYSEGRGVYTSMDAQTVYWTATALGKNTGRGRAASYRSTVYFQTASQRFERLNSTVGIVDFQVDENGNTRSQMLDLQ